jgi:hypothetical protein
MGGQGSDEHCGTLGSPFLGLFTFVTHDTGKALYLSGSECLFSQVRELPRFFFRYCFGDILSGLMQVLKKQEMQVDQSW